MRKMSVLMPVYNDRRMPETVLGNVISSAQPEMPEREAVLVYAASDDGTRHIYFWVKDDVYKGSATGDILAQLSKTRRLNRWIYRKIKPYLSDRAGMPGCFFNGKILRKKRFGKFQLKAYDLMIWLWKRADWVPFAPGLSAICVAIKPGP